MVLGDAEQGRRDIGQVPGAFIATQPAQCIGVALRKRGVIRVQQQEHRLGVANTRLHPFEFVATLGRAIENEAESAEGVLSLHAHADLLQVENEEPQPQVVFALGLRITNCEPERFSA